MATKKHDPDTLDDLQEVDPVQKKYEAEALAEQKKIDEATAEPAPVENDEVAQLRKALKSLLVRGASSGTGQWATLTVPAEAVATARALAGLGDTPDAENAANPL